MRGEDEAQEHLVTTANQKSADQVSGRDACEDTYIYRAVAERMPSYSWRCSANRKDFCTRMECGDGRAASWDGASSRDYHPDHMSPVNIYTGIYNSARDMEIRTRDMENHTRRTSSTFVVSVILTDGFSFRQLRRSTIRMSAAPPPLTSAEGR